VAGLKWQVEQAARNLEAERRRGEALSRERESLANLRAQAENATHTQACSDCARLKLLCASGGVSCCGTSAQCCAFAH